jgi:hypothetical protein
VTTIFSFQVVSLSHFLPESMIDLAGVRTLGKLGPFGCSFLGSTSAKYLGVAQFLPYHKPAPCHQDPARVAASIHPDKRRCKAGATGEQLVNILIQVDD